MVTTEGRPQLIACFLGREKHNSSAHLEPLQQTDLLPAKASRMARHSPIHTLSALVKSTVPIASQHGRL